MPCKITEKEILAAPGWIPLGDGFGDKPGFVGGVMPVGAIPVGATGGVTPLVGNATVGGVVAGGGEIVGVPGPAVGAGGAVLPM